MKNYYSLKHIFICLAIFGFATLLLVQETALSYLPFFGFLLCPLVMIFGMKFMSCESQSQKNTTENKAKL